MEKALQSHLLYSAFTFKTLRYTGRVALESMLTNFELTPIQHYVFNVKVLLGTFNQAQASVLCSCETSIFANFVSSSSNNMSHVYHNHHTAPPSVSAALM